MWTGLMLIACAFVLLEGSLYLMTAIVKNLEKITKFLVGFQALIGVMAMVMAVTGEICSRASCY